jgi:hypothetical protein
MAAIDLSGVNTILFDVRASRTGSNLKFGIHDTGGTTTEITPNITSADTFQTVTWDISGVSDANKNAVDTFVITVVNADAANTFYVDNFYTAISADFTTTALELTLTVKNVTYKSSTVVEGGALTLSLWSTTIGIGAEVTTQELTATLIDPTYTFDYAHTATALELTSTLKDGTPFLITRIIRKTYTFGVVEQVTETKLHNLIETAVWEISNQVAGDVLTYDATQPEGSRWIRLAKGTAGQILTMGATYPEWK